MTFRYLTAVVLAGPFMLASAQQTPLGYPVHPLRMASPFAPSGATGPLAISSVKRPRFVPNIPAVAEAGPLSGFDVNG